MPTFILIVSSVEAPESLPEVGVPSDPASFGAIILQHDTATWWPHHCQKSAMT